MFPWCPRPLYFQHFDLPYPVAIAVLVSSRSCVWPPLLHFSLFVSLSCLYMSASHMHRMPGEGREYFSLLHLSSLCIESPVTQ